MLTVKYHQWNQTVEQLREMSLTAVHPRTRERFMALYEICLGKSATRVGQDTQRNPQTIMDWVHRIYLDTDEGYGWSIKGERFWVSSCSPGLKKVSFYGVYLYNLGQVRFFPYDRANGLNSIEVVKQLRAEFPALEMTLVWDGAPYHRSGEVKTAIAELEIELQPLPGYSPDFMPVEHLWQWLREDVTYHTEILHLACNLSVLFG